MFIFSATLAKLVGFVSAQNYYFNYSIPSNFLGNEKEYKVKFIYSLSGATGSDFIVIPSTSQASIQIFNEPSNLWVFENSPRTSYPRLSESMRIKIAQFSKPSQELCFKLQHIKTGRSFDTPCKPIWSRQYYSNYLDQINQRLKIFP